MSERTTSTSDYFRDQFRLSRLSTSNFLDHATGEAAVIVQRLATRRYHLPGYSYWQDLVQFVLNNHTLLSFCCSHRLHPLTMQDRVFLLVGSMAFGLAATSGVYIWFYIWGRESLDLVVVEIPIGLVASAAAVINSIFDLFLWYMQSCPCCRPGALFDLDKKCYGKAWVWVGRHLAACLVGLSLLLASGAALVRYWVEADDGDNNNNQENDEGGGHGFSFLISYAIECILSFFLFDPIIAFVLFSGVLGCFRLPILGGRPWEMRSETDDSDASAMASV
mmetsp:Transcript_2962/g.8616  ORF Transcript_2962/g.8616 Transcript_2962/m.8616 type:complete len:278 (-) Transcript_2962:1250-2083(-)